MVDARSRGSFGNHRTGEAKRIKRKTAYINAGDEGTSETKKEQELEERIERLETQVFGGVQMPQKLYVQRELVEGSPEYQARIMEMREAIKNIPPARKTGEVITLDEIHAAFERLRSGSYGFECENAEKP